LSRHPFLYILPNIFTAASAYIGVLSIIYSINGRFELAAWLIVIAAIFDGLDGRVARATGTTSRFGMEFDSLSDIIAFGVAPSILIFTTFGIYYGKFGALVSALFVVFGAIRLARFNVTTVSEPNVFIGLPIPSAAIFCISAVLAIREYEMNFIIPYFLGMVVMVSFLMVSNIRYPSFKKLNDLKHNFKKLLVFIVTLLSLIYLFPIESMLVLSSLFIFGGIIRAFYYVIKKRKSTLQKHTE